MSKREKSEAFVLELKQNGLDYVSMDELRSWPDALVYGWIEAWGFLWSEEGQEWVLPVVAI